MEEKSLLPVSSSAQGQEETNSISFLFHLVTITFTCSVAFLLIYFTVPQSIPAEDLFLIKSLTPKKMSEYGNVPIRVRTGLSIYKWREFDMVANNFVFEGTIWFEFDPARISLDAISSFDFEKGDILHISPPLSKLENGKVFATYSIVVKFKTELDYRLFPLDDHMLTLVLVNKKVSPGDMIFDIDNQSFNIDKKTVSYGFLQSYQLATPGYITEVIDTRDSIDDIDHPAIQFSILYRRWNLKYGLVILLPMLVFIIVMLTAFSYDPNKYFSSIMVANGASLSGLIAFRFVIENMSPKVGYFMLSDYFYLVFLTLGAMLFLIGIFSLNISMHVKKMLILLVHAFLIGAFAVIVAYALSFAYHGISFF
jgi:hypothetical protein